MRTTVPADSLGTGLRYGLGIASMPLSCGGVYWGHNGGIPGYGTRGGATDSGRAASVAMTSLVPDDATGKQFGRVMDAALCR
jgi:D-alanyl-D-alanine carboxypeptidase